MAILQKQTYGGYGELDDLADLRHEAERGVGFSLVYALQTMTDCLPETQGIPEDNPAYDAIIQLRELLHIGAEILSTEAEEMAEDVFEVIRPVYEDEIANVPPAYEEADQIRRDCALL